MKNLIWMAILVIMVMASCKKDDGEITPNDPTPAVMPDEITITAIISVPTGVQLTNSQLGVRNPALNIGRGVNQEHTSSNLLTLVIKKIDVSKFYNNDVEVIVSAGGINSAEQNVGGEVKLSMKLDKSTLTLNNVSLNWQ